MKYIARCTNLRNEMTKATTWLPEFDQQLTELKPHKGIMLLHQVDSTCVRLGLADEISKEACRLIRSTADTAEELRKELAEKLSVTSSFEDIVRLQELKKTICDKSFDGKRLIKKLCEIGAITDEFDF